MYAGLGSANHVVIMQIIDHQDVSTRVDAMLPCRQIVNWRDTSSISWLLYHLKIRSLEGMLSCWLQLHYQLRTDHLVIMQITEYIDQTRVARHILNCLDVTELEETLLLGPLFLVVAVVIVMVADLLKL